MYDLEKEIYKKSYDLHRLFYETPEESRDDNFWRQIKDRIFGFDKLHAPSGLTLMLIQDVLSVYEQYEVRERARSNTERIRAAERKREEIARAEARTKAIDEVERLERELAEAKSAL